MGKGDEKDPPLRADARTHGGEPATGKGAAADGMMDRWFQQQLRHLYNDVVNEPLPHEFLEDSRKNSEPEARNLIGRRRRPLAFPTLVPRVVTR